MILDHRISLLTCTMIQPTTRQDLEKMIMRRDKNRCTLTYYLLLQKAERNQLSAENIETIEREMAKEKGMKKGVTLQSTAECISNSENSPPSPLKIRNKKSGKATVVRNVEQSMDASELPALVTKKAKGSPLRKVIKVNRNESHQPNELDSPGGGIGDVLGNPKNTAFHSLYALCY